VHSSVKYGYLASCPDESNRFFVVLRWHVWRCFVSYKNRLFVCRRIFAYSALFSCFNVFAVAQCLGAS
jgi:hypothetical protein